MNSFFKTLFSLSSITIISIFQFGCGDTGFFADPALLEERVLSSNDTEARTGGIELKEGYVLVGDMAVHRSKIHSDDLKMFFPDDYEEHKKEVEAFGVFEDNIQLWPNGVMPLEFRGFSSNEQRQILDYCAELSRTANVECKRRSGERDYVRIEKAGGSTCGWSYYGRVGGRQEMAIGSSCFTERTIKHEIMHAFGVGHEMNRIDRDNHVKILWNNMNYSSRSNFARINVNTTRTAQYDFDSIMHYASFSSQKRVGLYTILRKQKVNVAPSNCEYPNPSYPPDLCRNGGMTDIIPLNRVPSRLDNQILAMKYGAPQNRAEAEQLIHRIFQKYFNRNADPGGLDYWVGQKVNGNKNDKVIEKDIIFAARGNDQNTLVRENANIARNFLLSNNFSLPNFLRVCSAGQQRQCATIANGRKFQSCNAQGSDYGSCTIIRCNTGFKRSGNACVSNQSQQQINENRNFVNSVYRKYFNRSADTGGRDYWVSQLASKSRKVVEKDIIFGARDSAQYRDRTYLVNNKASIARSFLLSNGFSLPSFLRICTPNLQVRCGSVANGSKYKSCNSMGSAYGSCSIIRCNSGYKKSGSRCEKIKTQADLNKDFIRSVYRKYFNRTPDTGGLNYWAGQLNSKSRKVVEKDIIFGARDSAAFKDRTYIIRYRSNTAKNFLRANGFPFPSWLK